MDLKYSDNILFYSNDSGNSTFNQSQFYQQCVWQCFTEFIVALKVRC